MSDRQIFIGIDVGTQGVKVVCMGQDGALCSSRSKGFSLQNYRTEQAPEDWWSAVLQCLQLCAQDLGSQSLLGAVQAILVTSTSGTVIPLDHEHRPVSPALMYSDARSALEAEECRAAASSQEHGGLKHFNPSSGLPKIVWYMRHFPEKAASVAHWIHAADYITGKLCGIWEVTDYSNALKTGYDIEGKLWPDYMTNELKIPAQWLPAVVPSGTAIGNVTREVAELTGLSAKVTVCAGITDGCGSQIASGAIRPGDWNTTIGTTMVIKGVTHRPLHDPLGRLYNHRHPDGLWMPGGASNTGSDWVSAYYAASELNDLTKSAARIVPTSLLVYPLLCKGERFPFLAPDACGFGMQGLDATSRFASSMEGVAYIERLSLETMRRFSGEPVQAIYTAGGASNNELWLRIRSSVLNVPIIRMKCTEAAAGAAILAASRTCYGSLQEASRAMNRTDTRIEPQGNWIHAYDDNYKRFIEKLKEYRYLEFSPEEEK